MSYNAEEKRNDGIDFLIDSFNEITETRNLETGKMERVLEHNPKIAWFQAHNINRPFGIYAKLLEKWENLSIKAHSMMSPEPAEELAKDIILKLNEHKRGIDGKNSETYRDENNTQSSVFQILTNKEEKKTYTVKGDVKKSFMDGLLGREGEEERD